MPTCRLSTLPMVSAPRARPTSSPFRSGASGTMTRAPAAVARPLRASQGRRPAARLSFWIMHDVCVVVGGREPEPSECCIRGMGRHLSAIATAIVVGLLVAPAVAPAKEISKVSVCGTSGHCTTYDKSDFKTLIFLAEDAGPTDPPAAAAPWYRVRFTVDEREHGGGYESWTVAYVPSAGSLRVRGESGNFAWVALNPRTAAVLKRAVGNLPAFPKAR